MRVESLRIHSVKSTRTLPVRHAAVERSGLANDRRWAVVDPDGEPLTARTHDRLLSVTATPDATGALTLTTETLESLHVPVPLDGPPVAVRISRLEKATAAGPAPDAWFSDLLEKPVRLVWLDNPARRPVSTGHGGLPGDPLSLADAGPLLLTTLASLRRLNEWIAATDTPTPLPMDRFRPNVVVDAAIEPFVEDRWRRIRIGDIDYRFAECCPRCVLTTIDPDTRAHGKEPIRTLSRYRRWDGATWFGIRIVPTRPGSIRVGDTVTVQA